MADRWPGDHVRGLLAKAAGLTQADYIDGVDNGDLACGRGAVVQSRRGHFGLVMHPDCPVCCGASLPPTHKAHEEVGVFKE